jgi:choline dehydrogenase
MYPTERKADASVYYPLSGRVMGGGSSVNMMAVVHPTQHDLDTWARLGNPGWSYEDCLPVLKRIESDQEYGDEPQHGSGGPLHVQRTSSLANIEPGLVKSFIDRAVSMGLPLNDDWNVPDPSGVVRAAQNVKDGLRQSTAVAYLDPARDRPNLTIMSDAQVQSLKVEDRRVTGVTYEREGVVATAQSDTVVLSAGVYHSPQILLLSGVGPENELSGMGIPIVHALPGVGANYQDHASVTLTFTGTEGFNPDWVVPGFRLTYKSDPTLTNADFHIFMRAPVIVEGLLPMMPITANLIEQRSRGRITLASTDPHDLPLIDDGLLQHPADIAAMASAMRFIHELVDHESLRDYFGDMLQPAPGEDWEEFALTTYDCYHHGVGTCKMGPADDNMSVVDHKLKVHGLENLYVADASVMPTVTHANTNISAIMIGERVSDFIKEAGG